MIKIGDIVLFRSWGSTEFRPVRIQRIELCDTPRGKSGLSVYQADLATQADRLVVDISTVNGVQSTCGWAYGTQLKELV